MKSSLISLAGATLIFLIVLGAYGMWYTTVAKKSAAVATLESTLVAKKDTIKRIAFAQSTLLKNDDPAHRLSQYFVSQADIVSFISMLEGVAKKRGTVLEVASVSASDNKSGPATLSFTLSIEGAFDALMQTLGTLEFAPYNLSFSGVALSKGEKKLWHAEVQMLVGSTR